MAAQSNIKLHGSGTLADILGDAVAYRLLEPADGRLPGLTALRRGAGLGPEELPRKVEPAYGRVVSEILREAARLQSGSSDLDRVVMIGDTEHNDGGAMVGISRALECPGAAFICDETADEPRSIVRDRGDGRAVHLANHWRMIADFETELAARGFVIGSGTVVVLDIDKTLLGARGRNNRPIDEARVAAVLRTARELGTDVVDETGLMAAYHHFNQPPFHSFTTDNQDYLAYLAFLVGGGWATYDELDTGITGGRFETFSGLLAAVSAAPDTLDPAIRPSHERVVAAVEMGDPTPFKDFRRAEYRETVDRMSPGDRGMGTADLLGSRLTITAEVWLKAQVWRDRGALLFGLSDKPDEASFPPPELEAEGYLPLHRTQALIVGETGQLDG